MAGRNLRGVDKKQTAQILEKLTEDYLLNNPNGVFKFDSNVKAFGQYTIKTSSGGYMILKRNVNVHQMSNLRSALSWCVADKYNLLDLKFNLTQFDNELSRRETDVQFYIHTIKNSADIELKNSVFNRLIQCKDRIKWLKKKLNKCINSAKYCQQKGFDNETSRFGLQKPSREITKSF